MGTNGSENMAGSGATLLTPWTISVLMPSGQTGTLKSWEIPARYIYTSVPTATAILNLVADPAAVTIPITSVVSYEGLGFVFEISNLVITGSRKDILAVGPGGTRITYTTGITSHGAVPEFFVGFETAGADFGFSFHDFETEPGDAVVLTIDVEHLLVELEIVTASPTDDVIFSFAMERIGDTIEVFESPDEGLTLANHQILMVDYSEWDGNGKPLKMGYDDNYNALLDPEEIFETVDSGDIFEEE